MPDLRLLYAIYVIATAKCTAVLFIDKARSVIMSSLSKKRLFANALERLKAGDTYPLV